MGADEPAIYALEGSIAVAGVAMRWLRDNLKLLNNVSDSRVIAENAREVGEVVFVPAFSGLYAPYWRQDARRYVTLNSNDLIWKLKWLILSQIILAFSQL